MHETNYVAMLWKGTNWRLTFPWRKINWHVLQIAKVPIKYAISFMISKRYHEVHVFVPKIPEYMDTCKLTERRNFKAFLKENYAVALDSCYLFTNKYWSWNWPWYWKCLWILHTLSRSGSRDSHWPMKKHLGSRSLGTISFSVKYFH